MHILVAEDDRDIADLIALYVGKAGWTAHVASNGADALQLARSQPLDAVVLDVMMPGISGLEVCRALRAEGATAALPIIMVTARGEEADRILGLDLGADDYITKPFSPNELIARLRALTRRVARPVSATVTLTHGALAIDLSSHTVTDAGREVKLTAKEFLLLRYLMEHKGRVLSRDRLLSDVWGYTYTGGTRTVDVHVRRLREKLPTLVDMLETVKQFGYKLVDE
ncbi:MAG: response regulator transcription factor [Vicinamibacterales bacterium]